MIIECKSCGKKFNVPDSAISEKGRLVQCSSCGNKWTQFPSNQVVQKTKKIPAKKIASVSNEKNNKKTINVIQNETGPKSKKRKKIRSRTGPTLYSAEYLQKKHGLSLDEKVDKKITKAKKVSNVGYGFYSYIITFVVLIIFFFGILNLTQDILIYNFPFLEKYIEYIFETVNNLKIIISTWNLLVF